MWGFLIVATVFVFVWAIVKMSLEYSERIERIKHGYPLESEKIRADEKTGKEYIDARGEEKLQ